MQDRVAVTKLLEAPKPEQFSRLVKQYEFKYGELEKTYLIALKDFRDVEASVFSSSALQVILHSYLLKWGRMGRVLGYLGCKRISEKIKEMEPKFATYQRLTLSTVDLNNKAQQIEELYEEILNVNWLSEKGRNKRVGPTSTAKVLHLALPNLLMIWDRRIRNCYGFKDSGRDYVGFLRNMQDWNKKLSTTIEALQNKFGKSCTKLLDEYNWKKCWG